MKKQFRFLVSVLNFCLVFSALADHGGGGGSNGSVQDEFDVDKYQQIYNDSVRNLQQSERVLAEQGERLREAVAALNQAEARLRQIQQGIVDTRAQSAHVEHEIGELNSKINQLNQSISQAQTEISQLEGQVQNSKNEVSALQAHMDMTQSQAQQLERVAGEKLQVSQAKRKEAGAKQGEVLVAEKNLKETEKEIQKNKNQVMILAQALANLESKIIPMEGELASLIRQKEFLEGQLPSLEAVAQSKEAEATRLESDAREAVEKQDPSAPELLRLAGLARGEATQARAQVTNAQAELGAQSKKIEATETNLNQLKNSITEKRTEMAQAQGRVDSLQGTLAGLHVIVARLGAEYTTLDQAAKSLEADTVKAQAEAKQAAELASAAQTAFQSAKKRLEEFQVALVRKQTQLAGYQNELQRSAVTLRDWQNQMVEIRNRLARLEGEKQEQEGRVTWARTNADRAAEERDNCEELVANLQRKTEFDRQKLEQVRATLAQGVAMAESQAQKDATSHGSVDGTNLGSSDGARDGEDVGARNGKEQGILAGKAQARAIGERAGKEEGRKEGSENGSVAGRNQGTLDGPVNGRNEGLKESYRIGYKEGDLAGYPEGEKAGHAQGGYKEAYDKAYVVSRERARIEGERVGVPVGKKQAEDKYYNADLKDQVLPNSAVFEHNWEDQRGPSFNPKGRFFPQHPRLNDAYFNVYVRSYESSAGQAYEVAYQSAYKSAYESARVREFETYSKPELYPEEEKDAFAIAKREAYRKYYDLAYSAAYEVAYRPLYNEAYRKALPDGSEEGRLKKVEGYKSGYNDAFARGKNDAYQADLAQGKKDGDKNGYAENIAGYTEAARLRSFNETEKFFIENAVLRFDGFAVGESNDDTIFAPGETVFVNVAVKNFGKASQVRPVSLETSRASNGIDLQQGRDTLTALPGQSRTLVMGVAPLKISTHALEGSREKFTATLSYDGKVLGQTDLSFTVSFPYVVPTIGVKGVVAAETDNKVEVHVRNRSSKISAKPVTVKLISTDGLSRIQSAEQTIGKLSPGESTTKADFVFNFPKENSFKELQFLVEVREGDWLLGRQSFKVNSSKRWEYNPGSLALVIISSRTAGDRLDVASKKVGASIDIWDTQIEGPLTEDVAKKYLNQGIFLSTLDGPDLDQSDQALESFLTSGGKVFAGLGASLGRAPSQRQTRLEFLLNSHSSKLTQVQLGEMIVAEKNYFEPSGTTPLIVFGRGASLEGMALAHELLTFGLLIKNLDEKTSAFLLMANLPQSTLTEASKSVLLYELLKEMRDDALIEGFNFRDNVPALRLTRYLNIALAKSGNDRSWLASIYPDLERGMMELAKMKGDHFTERQRTRKLLKPLRSAYRGLIPQTIRNGLIP